MPYSEIRRKFRTSKFIIAELLICSARRITCGVPIYFSVTYNRLYRKWVPGTSKSLYGSVSKTVPMMVVIQGRGEFYLLQVFCALKYLLRTPLFQSILYIINSNNYNYESDICF
jgi:hypothetical protein